MPVLAFFAVVGFALVALLFVADATLERSRHGGLTSRMIYLEGKELAAMYPPCRRPIRSLKKLRD